ncbi:cache domain-containing protein [Barrientosiimonas humi]|uniref:cache domain-containing protein n=1 Tax=Barrientosiimonas humi TaxID=999931 RepID=UPI00370DAF8F
MTRAPGTDVRRRGPVDAAGVIRAAVADVFATVGELGQRLRDTHDAARERGDAWRAGDVAALREPVVALLGAPGAVPVGAGAILAPDVLADAPLQLEWWQVPAGASRPTRLEVDLNPSSLGFYDYLAAEWFDVPLRTGRRHVVGPYVDVHGTDLYVLTFTEPVHVDGEFVGVVGADVPSARLEGMLLPRLGDPSDQVLVLDDDGRVVLSTSGRWLVGSLLPRPPARWARQRLLDLPWTVLTPGGLDTPLG